MGYQWKREVYSKLQKEYIIATDFDDVKSVYPSLTTFKLYRNDGEHKINFRVSEKEFQRFEEEALDKKSVSHKMKEDYSQHWQEFLVHKEKTSVTRITLLDERDWQTFVSQIAKELPKGFTFKPKETTLEKDDDCPITAVLHFQGAKKGSYIEMRLTEDSCKTTIFQEGKRPLQYFSNEIENKWHIFLRPHLQNKSECQTFFEELY